MCGELVFQFRKEEGISQSDLAARCNILGFAAIRETISQIERGSRGVSDLELVLLAQALKISVTDLIPKELPVWKKDMRSPFAYEDDE